MSGNAKRSTRAKRQPSRHKDNVELDLDLIERIEINRSNRGLNLTNANYARLLCSFINAVNESYSQNQQKMEQKKKLTLNHRINESKPRPSIEISLQKNVRQPEGHLPPKVSTRRSEVSKYYDELKREKSGFKNQEKSKNPAQGENKQRAQLSENQSRSFQPKINQSRSIGKPFKRSSYHVGIAYNIYMSKLKNEMEMAEIKDHNMLDPTYFARKLKVEQILDYSDQKMIFNQQ